MPLTLLEIIALTGILRWPARSRERSARVANGVDGAAQPDDAAGAGRCAAAVAFVDHQSVAVAVRAAHGALCRRLWPMMLCVTLGTLLSAGALTATDGRRRRWRWAFA